jgi:hypothetical protein
VSRILFFVCLLLIPSVVAATPDAKEEIDLIKREAPRYLGTGSCASSNCHGSATPRNSSNVLQNEYRTWSAHDKHAKAWLILKDAAAKRIGDHLGISDVSSDPGCVSCHGTHATDASHFTEGFKIEDGVTCETCHGAAEHYVKSHTQKGVTRETLLKDGLKDLVPLSTRAQFCLTCHYGSENAAVNHRLIGAGHPRLSFELDTYSMLQPYHWVVDADYVERKAAYSNVQAWIIGQIELSNAMLQALNFPKRLMQGPFPELSLLTCYSCHHSLTDAQWKVREYKGKPGELRLNTASLLMVQHIASALELPSRNKIVEGITQLEADYATLQVAAAVKELQGTLEKTLQDLSQASFDAPKLKSLLRVLTHLGATVPHLPYESAEQIAMGLSAVLASAKVELKELQPFVDAVYASLKSPHEFRPEEFTSSCKKLASKL